MNFADMAADDDPTRIHDQLVVTVDAQLFYSVLAALPYLVDYPYECTEQTLNRFLCTSILTGVFDRLPAGGGHGRRVRRAETRTRGLGGGRSQPQAAAGGDAVAAAVAGRATTTDTT